MSMLVVSFGQRQEVIGLLKHTLPDDPANAVFFRADSRPRPSKRASLDAAHGPCWSEGCSSPEQHQLSSDWSDGLGAGAPEPTRLRNAYERIELYLDGSAGASRWGY